MILSFGDKRTREFAEGQRVKAFDGIQRPASNKLAQLDAATSVLDLQRPGNRCLTGRHPWRYGISTANAGHLRQQEITLAEALQSEGYRTGHFGKWHLGTLDPEHSGKGAGRNPHRNYMTPGMSGFGEWFATEYSVPTWDPMRDNASNRYYHNGRIATENFEGCDSRVLMDRAIPFIRNAAQGRTPFLAVIWFHAPHEPVFAEVPHLQLECREFRIEPGKQPVGEALFKPLPPRATMLEVLPRGWNRALGQIGFERLACGGRQGGVLNAQHAR